MVRGYKIIGVVAGVIAVAIIVIVLIQPQADQFREPNAVCKGSAACIIADVTRVIDGDTLDVGTARVRLALVNTPEVNEPGYNQSSQFSSSICPIGSEAIVDEDDGQRQGSFGRTLAKVSCGGKILNAELLTAGLGVIDTRFCSVSEFSGEDWARTNGCQK